MVYLATDAVFTDGTETLDPELVRTWAQRTGALVLETWPEGLVADLVVADLQTAGRRAFRFLALRARRLVGWDISGPSRRLIPFLVDSLPHETQPLPNVRIPGLLGLGPSVQAFDRPLRSILAVFGGADPAGLTARFLLMVGRLQAQGRWPYRLTVVRGPLATFTVPPGIETLDAPDRLAERLGEHDLTVTSWGLTALESLWAGTPVLLLHPTAYHLRLARRAGLPSFGVRRPQTKSFLEGLAVAPPAARRAAPRLLGTPVDPAAYFAEDRGSEGKCPVCLTAGHPVFARTEHKSYHRCGTCGMEYLSVHRLPPKVYSEAYFFDEYQKQYGKTYLDDFSHIQAMGSQRISILEKSLGSSSPKRIFDVGCAYGPFLAAAAVEGHLPFGLDIAPEAVEYVRSTLGFPAVQASFLDLSWDASFPGVPAPDAVTLWYVIEHFPDLNAVLAKANALLPLGGVLAFSTPNGRGLSRRFRPERFWQESPDDHFSIWNPSNSRRVLRRFGFEVVSLRITGQHPERFPGLKKSRGIRYSVVAWLGRRLGWGDTFEVYARKIKELS